MSFNRDEKQLIQAGSTTLNIGSIGSVVGNLGAHNSSGDIYGSAISTNQIKELTRQLRPHVASLASDGADAASIRSSLDTLEAQVRQAKPDQSVARSALNDLRNALSGAAGNIIASGAITMIAKMLGG